MDSIWSWETYTLYLFVFVLTIFQLGIISRVNIGININISKPNKYIIKPQLFIALLPMILMMALRSSTIGQDLIRYESSYFSFRNIDFSVQWLIANFSVREPFFIILNLVTGLITNWNFQSFIFVTTLIQFFFIYKTLKKLLKKGISPLIPFGVLSCLIYIRSFSMVRQSIAMSMVVYAYTFLEEKNYKKFWVLSIFAIGIHYSAIVSVLVYFWSKEHKRQYITKFLLICAFFVLLTFGNLLIDSLFTFMGNKYSAIEVNTTFGWGNLLIRLPFVVVIMLYKKEMTRVYPNIKYYISIYYLDIIVSQLKYFNVQFERISLYTLMSLVFILPVLVKVLRKKFGYVADVIMFFVLLGYFSYTVYYYSIVSPYHIMPFKFFWDK
ncbi:EpsG family protein [Rossellomorea marisflavi]|uniref:EpsG family protein n=1 Tax=Rossellomorea marisflavi TaxID=189381 RepID=UPI003458B5A2